MDRWDFLWRPFGCLAWQSGQKPGMDCWGKSVFFVTKSMVEKDSISCSLVFQREVSISYGSTIGGLYVSTLKTCKPVAGCCA